MITRVHGKTHSITGLLILAILFGGKLAFAALENIEDSPDENVTTAEVTVSVLGKDSGIIISGATVRILGTDDSILITNASGEAEFSGISHGNVTVEVKASDWSLFKKKFDIDSDRTILIELVPLKTDLTVQVVGLDEGSEIPITGCTVRITLKNSPPIEKRTDKNGMVTIRDLPRGEMSIYVLAAGWETGSKKVSLMEDKITSKFTLQQQRPPSNSN